MIHSGKIYETDGANAVAVHLPDAIRPLSPVPHAPSLRYFRFSPREWDLDMPDYTYGNPASIIGPSQEIELPGHVLRAGIDACLAVIVVTDGSRIDVQEADDYILGLSLMLTVSARDLEEVGVFGRAWDIANALGPVVTTLEELEDLVVNSEKGRHYGLEAVLRVNGVERERSSTSELEVTGALALSVASQSSPVRAGDVFALGPVVSLDQVQPGDEIQFAVDSLGTLSLKLSE